MTIPAEVEWETWTYSTYLCDENTQSTHVGHYRLHMEDREQKELTHVFITTLKYQNQSPIPSN